MVGYHFGTSVSLPLLSLSLSLSLFQSPSFSHPPTPQSITLSHTLLIGWIVLNGKKEKGGKKERERWGGYERERERWGSYWVREGGRLKKRERDRERERRGSETDVPKLYPTMNMNSLWSSVFGKDLNCLHNRAASDIVQTCLLMIEICGSCLWSSSSGPINMSLSSSSIWTSRRATNCWRGFLVYSKSVSIYLHY